jgi:hypothetical protein
VCKALSGASLKHLSMPPLRTRAVGFPAWGIAHYSGAIPEDRRFECAGRGNVQAVETTRKFSSGMVLFFALL